MTKTGTMYLLACCISSTALAQQSTESLKVGDIRAESLTPYDNVWRYTASVGGAPFKVQGLWSDHLEQKLVNGRALFVRTQGMTYVNGLSSSVVNAFDPATLAPVYSELRGPAGTYQRREFSGAQVLSIRKAAPNSKADSSTTTLAAAPFDFFGGTYGLLLVGLPLKPETALSILTLAESSDTLVSAPLRVRRREKIQAGWMGTIDCTVVETEQDGGVFTFWLSRKAPYIIRLTIARPNNTILRWDMLGDRVGGLNKASTRKSQAS